MTLTNALLVLAALLGTAGAIGLVTRLAGGRARRSGTATVVRPERLGADGLGESATLLQFSTSMCSLCPGVHRMLSGVATGRPGVRHLDVDLTDRPDIARHFSILQTPTTLILDRDGTIQSRIGGVPRRDVLELELTRLTGDGAVV